MALEEKLDDHMELLILGLILANLSLYLSEVCKKVEDLSGIPVSQSTICRLLKKYGLTRKKVRQIALQRSDTVDREIFVSKNFRLFNFRVV